MNAVWSRALNTVWSRALNAVGAVREPPEEDVTDRGVKFGMMGGSRTAPTKNVGRLIGAFKTVSTKQINEKRQTLGVPVWQRNYYEHIIRDDNDLHRIREYIVHNPSKWDEDENNLNIR